jgi:CDP-diacylglycerol--serine O-phosphatidyltransferase
MNIKRHIPNFLTCCNLLCGCMGIITSLKWGYDGLVIASYFIFAACLFDFFDGFSARLLNVQSPIGKELDSLADIVTFGVLPGIMIFQLIVINIICVKVPGWDIPVYPKEKEYFIYLQYIHYTALLIPVFSALRLAKFNIDTRQSESFIGVPTPANAILISSLPLILIDYRNGIIGDILSNPIFLAALSIIMSLLLVAELPLFALKFKNFKWAGNEIRFIFLALSLVLLIALKWLGIPIIIFLYIILSVLNNTVLTKPSENPKL